MYSKVEIITPELAKLYLEKNIENNRKLNLKNINAYANSMKKGDWQLTSQGITFNESGNLTDGQHRLMAIIKADVPVEMYVTYGEPNNSVIHDRGRIRSISDVMNMASGNCKISAAYVSITNSIFNFSNGTYVNVPDSTKMKFIEEHENLLSESIEFSRRGANHAVGHIAPVQSAAFSAMYSGISKEKIKDFFTVLNSGFMDNGNQSAAIVARKFIDGGWKKEFDSYNFTARKRIFNVTCLAINDFVHGISRKKVYPINDANLYLENISADINRYYL